MALPIIILILGSVLFTAFLSGIFGMAGGLILMGVLTSVVPVSAAMVLHGLVQIVSNGWRAILWRRRIHWPIVGRFALGMLPIVALFGLTAFDPSAGIVFLGLGLVPFINESIPRERAPVIDQPWAPYICGAIVTSVQLLAGVAGPLLDVFFLRSKMDRREIVATKAAAQVLGHLAKIGQFGVILSGLTSNLSFPLWLPALAVPASIIGTSLAAPVLARISDAHFRLGMRVLLLTTGTVYLIRAAMLFSGAP